MGKYDDFRKQRRVRKIPPARVVAWIEQNFDFKTRKGGAEYRICDPFQDDSKFKFNINPELGLCNSWLGNEWAGPVNPETGKRNCSFVKFVKAYRGCSYREALEELLGGSAGVLELMQPEGRVTGSEGEGSQRKASVTMPPGAQLLAGASGTHAKVLKKWLKRRGYTEEAIRKHELYYHVADVYWPYFEFEELVYWQSRCRDNKRFNFPDATQYEEGAGSKGDVLYGFDDAEPANYLIITEAIFDQHTLGDQALATGGAVVTANQIKKIRLLGPRKGIILAPDNDVAGLKSVIANHQVLADQKYPLFFSLPPSLEFTRDGSRCITKDWNEMLTGLGMSCAEVRRVHDENIRRLTPRELVKLRKILRK
jgi:hypothetical protein